jgi:hypothetical protein
MHENCKENNLLTVSLNLCGDFLLINNMKDREIYSNLKAFAFLDKNELQKAE